MSRTRDDGPRPWLAGLLALVVTGAGHAYLRRWARALGWFLVTFATVVAFVPESVIQEAFTGTPADPFALAWPALVVLASSVDAYLLARRTRADTAGGAGDPAAGGDRRCPECGREIDADLEFDFCPWCSAELEPRGAAADDR